MRDAVITGTGSAGPWGMSAAPPRRVEGHEAHPSALELEPPGLAPRQRRYLGRNSRLAIAACALALESAAFPRETAAREALACWIATTRGASDPRTTVEMIREARRAGGSGPPVARVALEVYNRRRTQVQYLVSMETAVVGNVTTALGVRGPAHAVTTAGPAGGAQALARAVRAVVRGDAPAALACGVQTAEDPRSTEELLRAAGGSRSLVEGAGAVLVEDASVVAAAGRRALAIVRVDSERLDRPGTGGAGVAMPLWEVARRCDERSWGPVRVRGFAGHEHEFALLSVQGPP